MDPYYNDDPTPPVSQRGGGTAGSALPPAPASSHSPTLPTRSIQASRGNGNGNGHTHIDFPPTCIWRSLTRDYLHSITQFLSLSELTLVGLTCRSWRSVSLTLPARSDFLLLKRNTVPDSKYMRHVTRMTINTTHHVYGTPIPGQAWPRVPISQIDLDRMETCTPRLEKLKCDLNFNGRPYHLARRLPHLIWLDVTITAPESVLDMDFDLRWSHLRSLLDEIGRLERLNYVRIQFDTQRMDFWHRMSSDDVAVFDAIFTALHPLRHVLTSLAVLHMSKRTGFQWHHGSQPEEQVCVALDKLSRLTHLTHLNLHNRLIRSPTHLDILFKPAGLIALKELLFEPPLTDEFIPSLARLTSLTIFHPKDIRLTNVSFLSTLTRLETCGLRFAERGVRPSPESVVDALASLTHLRTIELQHYDMTEGHVEQIITSMRRLESLTLKCMPNLTTLSFLSRLAHLALTLKTFFLGWSGRDLSPSDAEVHHLHSLRRLESCTFYACFSSPLPDSLSATLTPGRVEFRSDLWPNLNKFSAEFACTK